MLCFVLSILTPVVEYLYPAYQSLEAVNKKDNGQQNRWLFFWIFYFAFVLVSQVLFLNWIPGFCIVRALVSLWLWHPEYNGGMWIYHTFVSKHFSEIEKIFVKVNTILNLVDTKVQKASSETTQEQQQQKVQDSEQEQKQKDE
ncbi:hypothetical protein PPERSA_01192 [Pseudocohnilembus persalinus]|uniref:TB2/DP1/HVA22-related protein n=1 Tax=Pseudocohnilembus persalinus TaxID=266149 RepID=A0A0V0R132_PSEPJ|nr:hypothetical protein PPERSA_01192 [Pseudocohnilembus persalinus]|eukprot:KRX08262.1 hypothetical protein PPERSA_01192 [Pseudocohnilembus persalinus]